MRRAAREKNIDDRFVGPAVSSTIFGTQQVWEGGPGYTERTNGEKRPAGQAIAKFTRVFSQ
tara:strand:- start:1290 stop:1472 length:183 start_codon:yes stop_codon:yes gene_type:complete